MKKLITSCVMLAAVTTASFAQTKKAPTKGGTTTTSPGKATPESTATKKAKAAQTAFGLNADQYNKIYNAEFKYERELFNLKAVGETASEGRMVQLNMFRDGEYKQHLTAAQYAQYETNKNP